MLEHTIVRQMIVLCSLVFCVAYVAPVEAIQESFPDNTSHVLLNDNLCLQPFTLNTAGILPTQLSVSETSTETTTGNPYSRALGPRIAGAVLLGMGAVAVGLGVIMDANDVFANSYEDAGLDRSMGEMFDKLTWIEGAIDCAIGAPLLAVGLVKYSQWKKWEKEHGNAGLTFRFEGSRFVLEF
jgi:hypothetical protein